MEKSYSEYADSPPSTESNLSPHSISRLAALSAAHHTLHGTSPSFAVRVPGRVNLIGEHIDYMGYSVMPMAITHDIMVVGSSDVCSIPRRSKVSVANMDQRYMRGSIDPDAEVGELQGWLRYVGCGIKAAMSSTSLSDSSDGDQGAAPRAGGGGGGGGGGEGGGGESLTAGRRCFNLVFDGVIPAGSGLSSSSALVCAAALASCAAWHPAMCHISRSGPPPILKLTRLPQGGWAALTESDFQEGDGRLVL